MKEDILKRAMFAMPLSKDARNSGILSGFEEEMDEAPDPSEEMPQMARNPQNPEILMNTMRGDMRSVDARYMELAQMVGEEAAMETPPEVLAMLQGQFSQQGGIGGLPQAQQMAPPPMAQGPGGAPQGPDMAMPPGMAGAPPFPEGGAEQAPPTPDGLPPIKAAYGAFITPATRLAQIGGVSTAGMLLSPVTRFAQFAADKMAPLAAQANAGIGRVMSQGFPQVFRPIFENVRGAGGRFTAEQVLKYPTLTQHLSNVAGPTATAAAQRVGASIGANAAPAALAGASILAASGIYKGATAPAPDQERAALMKQYEDLYYKGNDRSVPLPALGGASNDELKKLIQGMSPPPVAATGTGGDSGAPAPAAIMPEPSAETAAQDTASFIQGQLARPNLAATTGTPVSRADRIRQARDEYAPLYKELLGDGKEEMYTNAMLMLADAGFKYAAAPAKAGTTPISLLSQSVQGIPQGFMALLAQAKDRQLKVDTAALGQAVTDVQEQDKYAQRLKELLIKGDYDLLKEQVKKTGDIQEDGGAGLLVTKTKSGSFAGTSIDPNNPTVQSALRSRYTLRDTDNPFVVNRGEAATTVETNKDERVKLTSTLRSLDNTLSTLDGLKGVYTQAYGPGAWFSDKVNNLLVPISPTAVVKPNLDLTDAASRISVGMNSILKNMASANDGGRVAVQEQEWARETAKGISDPTKFFADKEIAAKQFNSMEAMLRNARQQVITQLGYEKNDYVMNTPSTGTQSDPFVISANPDEQKRMFNFLGSTIGKIQDPRATVYVRMPNNTIQAFNPTQLKGLNQ